MTVGPVIWLNGLPGVGKYTIAQTMRVMDPTITVVDNHSLIDPVEERLAPEGRKHPRYNEERKNERQKALRTWVIEPADKSCPVVFTDFQSSDELGSRVAREYAAAAREAGRPFFPVYLTCGAEENMLRATNEERRLGGTTKLTDEAIMRMIFAGPALFRFEGQGVEIDVTTQPADRVASAILRIGHLMIL